MIILDTHIWVWWLLDRDQLSQDQVQRLNDEAELIGVCSIALWEIARACSLGKLSLPMDTAEWLDRAVRIRGVQVLALTPSIAVGSNELPGKFHRDPADQIIVATARLLNAPLLTRDRKIIDYPHVETVA